MKTILASELAAVAGGFNEGQVRTRLGYFGASAKMFNGPGVFIDQDGTRTPMAKGGYEYRFPMHTDDTTAPQFYKGEAVAKCPDSKISHCVLSVSPSITNLK